MSELKTIIVEDIPADRDLLESMLATECPNVKVVGCAESAEEGYRAIKQHRPDLVFIDIQLHRSTGFDMLRMLQLENAIDFEMIFVTAHGTNENETRAIDYSALDFIHKPPTPNALRSAVRNATRLVNAQMYKKQVDILMTHLLGDKKEDREIVFDLANRVKEAVSVNEILYLEAEGTITHVFLKSGRKLTAMKNLGHYSKMLMTEFDFFPIHNSIVVNKKEVRRIDTKDKSVILSTGKTLLCSRRGFEGFKEVWGTSKGIDNDNPLSKLWKRFMSE